jgi:hypothetical protein
MNNNKHLTADNPAFADRIARTRPGQANWAVDPFRTCHQCALWGLPGRRYHARQERPCAKYFELMRRRGPSVPHYATACCYFVQTEFGARAPNPPSDGIGQMAKQAK